MFEPKEKFQTVELHLEHVAEKVKERFNSIEEDVYKRLHVIREHVETELATIRSDIEQFRQKARAIEANLDDRFTTVFDRIAGIERKPTLVNTPPAPSQPKVDEFAQQSTAAASE